MAKVLIVHAHPEEKSFSSALAQAAREGLEEAGHEVVLKDLYREKFDPVSDRRNYLSVDDPDFFKQQQEERHASEVNGFHAELEKEIRELESADGLIFSYPLWWFSMPAILKGWVDRVFAAGRIYGGDKLYDGGLGKASARAQILLTTGGPNATYDGYGLNPPIEQVLTPIEHGIFWFNGFLPTQPTIAWGPARWSQQERVDFLASTRARSHDFFHLPVRTLPRRSEFESFANDQMLRTRVLVRRTMPVDDKFRSLLDAERDYLRELRREGRLLDFKLATQESEEWLAFLDLRTHDQSEVELILKGLPLDEYFSYQVVPLAKALL
jgi:NAD(P)H dehydrogenase (quinone)